MGDGKNKSKTEATTSYDVIVVGAGFAGMYTLHRLRQRGLAVKVFEAGKGVGGTWYWNRYPGARCDVESIHYQYGFSDEIQREWTWTEKFAAQEEILRYINHVAKRLDLLKDIQFETRVTSAQYDEKAARWAVKTDRGDELAAKYCIMASGCLSNARVPEIEGLDTFSGKWYHTGAWPHEGVDFTSKRVAVIGTGSSGIQSIPVIAEQAKQLTVFQRTPNFSMPSGNKPLTAAEVADAKKSFPNDQKLARSTPSGLPYEAAGKSTFEFAPEDLQREYRARLAMGGSSFFLGFSDLLVDKKANDLAAEFVRERIREIVKDQKTAEDLSPIDHPFGTKRPCFDTGYYETFNKPHVKLVNLRKTPIKRITPKGLVAGDVEYEVDNIVFATGFDAMTGSLLRVDIRGKGGLSLRDKWEAGPRTYLGLMTVGFPNLFMITGPGSPSVLSNMMVSIEQHVDWIVDCINYLQSHNVAAMEAKLDAEDQWVAHVNDVANMTLYPQANSWYLGANIPGKPRVFMPYVGGCNVYRDKCNEIARDGYTGFALSKTNADAGRDRISA